jgi:hypothetical protein
MIFLTIPTVILVLLFFSITVPLSSNETVATLESTKKLDYRFDGKISRSVLENYLARSATVASLLHFTLDDDLRMMSNTGVKFAGRVIWMWGNESRIDALVRKGKPFVKRIHIVDPDIILQGAIFEIVTRDVDNVVDPCLCIQRVRSQAGSTEFSL